MKHSIQIILTAAVLSAGLIPVAAQPKALDYPDYSYCGYLGSEQAIPMNLPIKAVVPCREGDATADIQAAIDYVSSLPAGPDGFRGVVLLEKGRYCISKTLWIKTSGVVLRGSGMTEDGTEILSTSTDRLTMIRLQGEDDREIGHPIQSVEGDFPCGTREWNLAGHRLVPGTSVLVSRVEPRDPQAMGQGRRVLPAKVEWEREVLSVTKATVQVDAPLTTAVKQVEVRPLSWPGRLTRCGVENLRLNSAYDETNAKDENHAWIGISMENLRDAWVRRVKFFHLAGSAVFVAKTASRVTVEDCANFQPISEIGGQRRYAFYINGPQCLCLRVQAENGYHDFAVGAGVHGPTAFVQCWSLYPYSYSGTIEKWSSGVLFDICSVVGGALRFNVPDLSDAFLGWSATNSMMWNSTAGIMSVVHPDEGENYANGAWAQFNGKGVWTSANNHVRPWSLYYAQLAARLGKPSSETDRLIGLGDGGTSTIEDAEYQIARSREALPILCNWSDDLAKANPLDTEAGETSLKEVWHPWVKEAPAKADYPAIECRNAVLVRDGKILTGGRQGAAWWQGTMADGARSPHLVRFALMPEGYGIVDDLDQVTDRMKLRGTQVMDFHYALWYDRRRDDHERVSRLDGDVKPPLYELPFGRSGEGRASDGLSLYDLTRWNNWYWNRLSSYADLADQKQLTLFYQHYFQHNILEAGAHWADFPWRSCNNVNQTGFPDPTPFAGNKRVFMAEPFYDETHPQRRELHRTYIRKCLDQFADKGSVIHFISDEFTGPAHFVAFWLETIAEWEAETGRDAKVALAVTKDVQDSLMSVERLAQVVDAIDIRFWWVQASGELYSPQGGQNLAPRQFERIEKPESASFETIYQAVRDMRRAYPGKAVLYSASGFTMNAAWAAFLGGGSYCNLPQGLPEALLRDAALMQPIDGSCPLLGKPGLGYVAFQPQADQPLVVDLSADASDYQAQWLDPRSGMPQGKPFAVKGGQILSLTAKGVLRLMK